MDNASHSSHGDDGVALRQRRSHLSRDLQHALVLREEAEEDDDEQLEDSEGYYPEALALVQDGLREKASDLHLDPVTGGVLIRYRIDGVLLDSLLLSGAQATRLINQLKILAKLDPTPAFSPRSGRVTLELDGRELDLRMTVAPCLNGEKLSIRMLESRGVYRDLDELGFEDSDYAKIEGWLDDLAGMLLVAGPTGSGKTTTLYGLLHRMKVFERHLLTIEDPVEYEVPGVTQIQMDPRHGLDFSAGVKTMLRLDPDYMLLGEIRDEASARAACDASASGKGLMSTLHSRDAVGVVSVLRNYGLTDLEISANLSMVVSQRLVRTLCEDCRVQQPPNQEETRWFRSVGMTPPEEVWHASGCETCGELGFSGRCGVFEIWRVDGEDYELILAHADERSIQEQLAKKGHRFLLDDALAKLEKGVTTVDELRQMGGLGRWRG